MKTPPPSFNLTLIEVTRLLHTADEKKYLTVYIYYKCFIEMYFECRVMGYQINMFYTLPAIIRQ